MCNGCGREPCDFDGTYYWTGDGRPMPAEMIALQQGVPYSLPISEPRRLSLWQRIKKTLPWSLPHAFGVPND